MIELVFQYDVDMTINKTYFLKPRNNGKVLTPAARLMRARIINDVREQVKRYDVENNGIDFDKPQEITILFIRDWFTQEGEVRKIDLDNRLKFLIDSIYTALNEDDKMIWRIETEKIQQDEDTARKQITNNKAYCYVTITNKEDIRGID